MARVLALFPPRPPLARWVLLLLLSILCSGLFKVAGLPASLLLGPMAAGIVLSLRGVSMTVPRLFHVASQGIIGVMIGRSMTPAILGTLKKDWLLSIGVMFLVVLMANVLGWLLGRLRVMPGSTAIWGLSPGAATVMMMMAEGYGADARLVAFMQYLRVVIVVTVASLVVRLWVHPVPQAGAGTMFPPVHWAPLGWTLLAAFLGAVLGRLLKIPGGSMLLPLLFGALLHGGKGLPLEIPPILLAGSYAFLGWGIGLGFTREIFIHAVKALPKTVLAILTLVLFSGGIAFLLVVVLSIDPLTAYLATSPGGMDSVAIIAASTHTVDLPFVMTLQTVRFLVVLLTGPALSRFLADRLGPPHPAGEAGPGEKELLDRVREDEDELD